ncbi:MAG: hypothetical protein HYR74_03450 [Candidatus Eisenbacteria bacterium]|nr:hypothetical protein [Candidatus Eisenbacteria bacterium]
MTGLVRRATILCAGGLIVAGAAMAGIPSATTSTIPTCITLSDAQSNAACNFMVIRDANNNPVAGSSITLDFSACTVGDVSICNVQNNQAATIGGASTQPAAATCGSHTVTVGCDALGQICLMLNGGSNLANGHGPASGNRPTCCTIYADSKIMGTVPVTVCRFDLASPQNNTINSGDLSAWLNYAGGAFGAYRDYADYNCSGTVNSGDLSQWLTCAGLGLNTSQVGCTTFCP